ncbi:MAG: mono/diheme cytochrome c family protein [Verrucomicrobiales bacterium]|jgi:mono/diheme cytochrome c family protein
MKKSELLSWSRVFPMWAGLSCRWGLCLLLLGLNSFAGTDHESDDAFWADAAALLPGFDGAPAEPGPSNQSGSWGGVIAWPHIPVSAANLPNGKIITYSGQERTNWPGTKTQTYWTVYDPATGRFDEDLYLDHEMFCAHLVMRTDGVLQTVGGRYTIEHSSVYDWRTNQWSRADDMNDRRWYTTSVALPDGDVFTVSGSGGSNTAERFDHDANTWNRLSGINWQPVSGAAGFESNWWPYVFVAPDGRLFHFGPTEAMHWVDPDGAGSRVSANLNVPGSHYPKHAGVVMYESGKFLVAGGAVAATDGSTTTACYVVDLNTSPPTVRSTNPMAFPRRFQNPIVLPTGEVMIVGGNTSGRKFSDLGTVLTPEIWNPDTEQWRQVADMATPRNYHSVGLLLPDGRVFAGGSGYNAGSANHQDAEIYTPPALFSSANTLATRPSIAAAPENVALGSVFNVSATADLRKFSMIRMSATTHGLSTDQRQLSIPFSETSSGQYQLVTHPNANVMVPGYWMLFGLNANGVYSQAATIHIKEMGDAPIAGLKGEYFDGMNFDSLQATRTDHKIDFNWGTSSPFLPELGTDTFSIRWTGWVVPDYTETYAFYTNSDDGVRLWVNGQPLVNNWTDHAPTENSGTIALTAGQPVAITLEHFENGGGAVMELRWSSARTTKQIIPERNLRTSDPAGSSVVSVDNVFELFVDGQLVQIGTEWSKAYHAAFSTGANSTIAIRACNTDGLGHAVGDFLINGQRFVTDSSWKVSGSAVAGWNQPGFDDSSWANATDNGVVPSGVTGMPEGSAARNIWSSNAADDEIFLRFRIGGPELGNIADQIGVVGNSANLSIPVSPGAGSNLIFSSTTLPSGLSIDQNTGSISGTFASQGIYDVTIDVTDLNGSGSDSTTFQWSVRLPGQGSGSLLRQWWTGLTTSSLSGLQADPRFPDSPTGSEQVTSFPVAQSFGDNYGSRLRGYIHVPVTGAYRFWISTDDGGQLLLSTDDTAANAVEIASVPDGQRADVTEWTKFPQQQSALVNLQGGQRYYLEILQADLGGADHINLAWRIPGDSGINVVDGVYVSPFAANRAPVLAAIGNQASTLGDSVTLPLSASDPDNDTPLTFTANGLPDGLFVSSSGEVFGTANVVGDFSVQVTVSDGNGGTDSENFSWSVNDTLTVTAPVTGATAAGGVVTFSGTSAGGTSPSYSWNFGDGTAEVTTSSPNVSHTYTSPGRYSITLTATDTNGDQSAAVFHHNAYPALTLNRPVESQSIIYETRSAANDRVWNVNPDNDTVAVHDAVTQLKLAEIPVGDNPRTLAVAPDGSIAVTNKSESTVSIINADSLAVVQTITLKAGSEPYGIVFSPVAEFAYVVLEGSGEIIKIDAVTTEEVGRMSVGSNPRHLSISHDGSTVFVSRFISPPVPGEGTSTTPDVTNAGGQVIRINANTLAIQGTIRLQASIEPDSGGGGRGIPNYLGAAAISPANDMAWVPSKQDNIQRGQFRDGLVITQDTISRAITSRIELSTLTETYAARVDHDDASVPNSAHFGPNGLYVFVAFEGSREVAVIDAYGNQELFRFDAGRAAQGLALSADGHTLFVHNFMDRSVSVHDITALIEQGQPTVSFITTLDTVSSEELSAQVLLGKQLFHDAVDNRLAGQDYLSCAICHNEGGQDGRVWDFTNLDEGLRNTIDLRGRGGVDHGPVHWTGNFDEIQDFEIPIRAMSGGSGLINGAPHASLGLPNAGRSADLDALAAYVASLDTFERSPYRNSDSSLTAQAAAGREVFRAQDCASCHTGERFTDSALNVLHDIGTLKPGSGNRLGGPLPGVDTPTLRGLWNGAPYLHDGSAPTLEAAVAAHNGVSLSTSEMQQLTEYLRQIDDLEESAPVITLTAPIIANFNAAPATITEGDSATLQWTVSDGGSALTSLTISDGIGNVLGSSSRSVSPAVTTTYTLSATNAIGSVTATTTVTVQPTTGGGTDEYPVTPDVIALYHFNGDYADESGNGHTLNPSGGVQRTAANLDWMNDPAGQVARFSAAGDTLSVSIPDILVSPDSNTPFTMEARVYVRQYLGWGVGNLPIVFFIQEWDAHFGLKDRKWGSPRGANIVANTAEAVNAQQVATLMPAGQWHLMQISYDGANTVTTRINGAVVSAINKPPYSGRTNNWVLTIGNFDGDIDEVVLRQSAEPGSTTPPPPDTTPPTVALSGPATASGLFLVNATFSESVEGFVAADLAVTNGSTSAVSGAGADYRFTVTPAVDGPVTITLPAGSATDAAGNPNITANTLIVSYTEPAGGGGGGADTIALYSFDADFNDSSDNGYDLAATSGVTIASGAARFTAAGQQLQVSISDSVVSPENQPVTIEARIFPRAYLGWSIGNLPILTLTQDWDSSLELRDKIWSSERAPSIRTGIYELVTSTQWKTLAPVGQWSTVALSYDGIGAVECRINGTVAGTTAWQPNLSRSNDWVLTLGNFDGDIDDVHIHSALPSTGNVANLVANSVAQGMTADYYEGANFEQLRFTRIDSTVDFDWGTGSPAPELSANGFSVHWCGCMVPAFTETYSFHATTAAADGIRVFVNDIAVIDNWNSNGTTSGTFALQANVLAMLVVEYKDSTGAASAKIEWSSSRQARQVIPSTSLTVNETSAVASTLDSYPGSWGEWLNSTRSNGFSVTDPDTNADGDYSVDLLEYALGTSPGTGIAGANSTDGGIGLEKVGSAQSITAVYRRPSAIGDIDYSVEVSADRVNWQTVDIGPGTTITRHRDGTETTRLAEIDALPQLGDSGFVRLRVQLVDSSYKAVTPECAWLRTPVHAGYQTIGISTMRPHIFAGIVASANGEALTYSGGGELSALLEDGVSYFLEVRGGALEGHRIDIDPARTRTGLIALDPAADANTLDELPASTVGQPFVVRPHRSVGEVFAKERFTGTTDPGTADRVHFFDTAEGTYDSYFLLEGGGDFHRWTTLANASLSDFGGKVIAPGTGVFLQRAGESDPLTLTQTGLVRDNTFRQPLVSGYNLVAAGYPVAQSPDERRASLAGGFLGSMNPNDADQIQVWRGDSVPGAAGYAGYFLLDAGAGSTYRYWTDLDNASLTNRNEDTLFHPGRAAFFLMQESSLSDYQYNAE